MKNLLRISHLEHKINDWVRSKIGFLVRLQEPVLATVKKLETYKVRACLTSRLFRAPWRMGDAVVGRGNAGWTISKSGHPRPCQNCSQGPPAENIGTEYLLKDNLQTTKSLKKLQTEAEPKLSFQTSVSCFLSQRHCPFAR